MYSIISILVKPDNVVKSSSHFIAQIINGLLVLSRFPWNGSRIPTWKACTISSASHRVPEPLRRTSSGGMGITVAREKMKGWMYVM